MSTTPSCQNKAVTLWFQGMLFLVLVASIGCTSSALPKRFSQADPNALCDILEWDIQELSREVATNQPPRVDIKVGPSQAKEVKFIHTSAARIYTNGTYQFTWNRGQMDHLHYTSESGKLPDELRRRLQRELPENTPEPGKLPLAYAVGGQTVMVGSDRIPLSVLMTFRYLQVHHAHSTNQEAAMAGLKTLMEWDDEVYRKRHPTGR